MHSFALDPQNNYQNLVCTKFNFIQGNFIYGKKYTHQLTYFVKYMYVVCTITYVRFTYIFLLKKSHLLHKIYIYILKICVLQLICKCCAFV